ncbi:MAG: 2-oxoglutarate dehydrogenase E1 component [Bdellovibrionales bacterium]|nr:2-oxoglutarate dehydrogenase E1 component [Bdellovibrionales bacterium]
MKNFDFAGRSNLSYLEQQYALYKEDPEKVAPEWRHFFDGVDFAQGLGDQGAQASPKEVNVFRLIRTYRDYGHQVANLDPLKLHKPNESDFQLANFGLADEDLDTPFQVGALIGRPNAPLREIIQSLKSMYCGTIAAQISGCEHPVRKWFQNEFENSSPNFVYTDNERVSVLKSLIKTESLEKFIHTRYVGTKRFSIEGGDALLPMLEQMVPRGTKLGVKELVIGMAHRGRINVLANFMDKGLDHIFAEFDGSVKDATGHDGDVKYHLGYSSDKVTSDGNCHISLAFNPSHLEAVSPVALGMTRAKQRKYNDTVERKTVIPVLIHGDAAFSGQGVVSETLQLSALKGYTVGGSIHIIINNQVGFTTDPECSRSTRYSSDMAKATRSPVILVNGDDIEACVRAIDMAVRFRQEFKQDVVIDLICYRRFGHNEGDEPAFTQPLMYDVIKKHPTLMKLYGEQLQKKGLLSQQEFDSFHQEKMDNLQAILDETRKTPPKLDPLAFSRLWAGLRRATPEDFDKPFDSSFKKQQLLQLAETIFAIPDNFNIHPKVEKLLHQRIESVKENKMDWGTVELLAYASLRSEKINVRLSGQDCKRGTFSHRHAVYTDTETGEELCPIKQLEYDGEFCIYNSSLSEMAVLGFEYGNASTDPHFLTIWEAQFGDFANGAQIIIDQFIASGEEKWLRNVGLTLFLPHGYEGQGPEHSSARLERFLQLYGQYNMQICNLTTPANLFHVLRRQIKRDFRKPLIVMTPKSLLRHPEVVSTVDDLCEGHFQEVIGDPLNVKESDVETLVICSGKVYFDLKKELPDSHKLAIVRLEQIAPFPRVQLTPYLNGFKRLKTVVCLQEEPRNMGSFSYLGPRLRELLDELGQEKVRIEYVGRTERASPAVGNPKVHALEQADIVQKVLAFN